MYPQLCTACARVGGCEGEESGIGGQDVGGGGDGAEDGAGCGQIEGY